MPLPQLNVHRHHGKTSALLTLAGEIDLETAPLMRAALERSLRGGVRTIDIDLPPATFRDSSGRNAFIAPVACFATSHRLAPAVPGGVL
ncbi:anti-sigma factor antagonist [Streptomyces sp. NPDC059991]|uniref:anti-sigma factor antagonist n=1 Tax=unclassified Streptomyces TaxID=2593676 RepID=UPI0036946DEC